MKPAPTELLVRFVSAFEEDTLNGTTILHFCDLVQGEELCYGVKCEECPLGNASVLKAAILKER